MTEVLPSVTPLPEDESGMSSGVGVIMKCPVETQVDETDVVES